MFLDSTGASHPPFTVCSENGTKEAEELLQKEEGILYADLDLVDCIEGKKSHNLISEY